MKKLISLILSIAICFTFLFITATPANAYQLRGYKVDEPLIFYAYSGFGAESRAHMRSAALAWNACVDSFTPLVMSTSTHSATSGYGTSDGKNYIYRINAGTVYVAQNRTSIRYGVVEEFDININVYYSWANSAQPNCYDVYSIVLHELGHTMGLEDLDERSGLSYETAVMWGKAQTNRTKRDLKQDDIDGIAAKYG